MLGQNAVVQRALKPPAILKPHPNHWLGRFLDRLNGQRRHCALAIPGHHHERFATPVQLAGWHLRSIRKVDQRPRRNAFAHLVARLQQPLTHMQRAAAGVEVKLLRVGAVVPQLVALPPELQLDQARIQLCKR